MSASRRRLTTEEFLAWECAQLALPEIGVRLPLATLYDRSRAAP
jgi:hypothetical protein